MSLKGVIAFVKDHKLVVAVSIISIPAGAAVLAYQRRQKAGALSPCPPIRPDRKLSAPPTSEELAHAERLENAWKVH